MSMIYQCISMYVWHIILLQRPKIGLFHLELLGWSMSGLLVKKVVAALEVFLRDAQKGGQSMIFMKAGLQGTEKVFELLCSGVPQVLVDRINTTKKMECRDQNDSPVWEVDDDSFVAWSRLCAKLQDLDGPRGFLYMGMPDMVNRTDWWFNNTASLEAKTFCRLVFVCISYYVFTQAVLECFRFGSPVRELKPAEMHEDYALLVEFMCFDVKCILLLFGTPWSLGKSGIWRQRQLRRVQTMIPGKIGHTTSIRFTWLEGLVTSLEQTWQVLCKRTSWKHTCLGMKIRPLALESVEPTEVAYQWGMSTCIWMMERLMTCHSVGIGVIIHFLLNINSLGGLFNVSTSLKYQRKDRWINASCWRLDFENCFDGEAWYACKWLTPLLIHHPAPLRKRQLGLSNNTPAGNLKRIGEDLAGAHFRWCSVCLASRYSAPEVWPMFSKVILLHIDGNVASQESCGQKLTKFSSIMQKWEKTCFFSSIIKCAWHARPGGRNMGWPGDFISSASLRRDVTCRWHRFGLSIRTGEAWRQEGLELWISMGQTPNDHSTSGFSVYQVVDVLPIHVSNAHHSSLWKDTKRQCADARSLLVGRWETSEIWRTTAPAGLCFRDTWCVSAGARNSNNQKKTKQRGIRNGSNQHTIKHVSPKDFRNYSLGVGWSCLELWFDFCKVSSLAE